MLIKHYTEVLYRVADPLRPGRTTNTGRLVASGATAHSAAGTTFEADEDGWFDVPEDVGRAMCAVRTNGRSGFYAEGAVEEHRRIGDLEDEAPRRRGPGRPPGRPRLSE